MRRRLLLAVLLLCSAAGIAAAGSGTPCGGSVTSAGNTFTAGTLKLRAGGGDTIESIDLGGALPGFDTGPRAIVLENAGTVHGDVSVSIRSRSSGVLGRAIALQLSDFAGGTRYEGPLSDAGRVELGHLEPGATNGRTAHIRYVLPTASGNELQGLTAVFDVVFRIDQTP